MKRLRWLLLLLSSPSISSSSSLFLPTVVTTTTALGLAATTPPFSSSSSSSASSSSLPTAVRPYYSLQRQHPEQTPAQVFESLAGMCRQEENELLLKAFDVYGDFDKEAGSSFLRRFEQEVVRAFGGGVLEDAVFMPSGVMAQSIALLIHHHDSTGSTSSTTRPGKRPGRSAFACHHTSHLLLHEQDAYRELLGMEAVVLSTLDQAQGLEVPPLNYPTVQQQLSSSTASTSSSSDQALKEVSTLILELPHRELGGKLTSWDDILLMRDFCRRHKIKFHCDGARLFEASAGYNMQTLSELVEPFDSMYISFYKGLGGISGAMLLGSKEFCGQARIWLRRFGGNLYTLLPYALSGWMGFQRNWLLLQHGDGRTGREKQQLLSFVDKKEKLLSIVRALSAVETISSVVTFDPAVPETNMVHGYLRASPTDCERALAAVEERCGIRVLERVRPVVVEDDSGIRKREPAHSLGYRSYFEWAIGENNGNIPDSCFLEGWSQFAQELLANNNVTTAKLSS